MDAYFNQLYVEKRLLNEYRKHNKLIIGLDFDDTIFDCHNKGHEFNDVIQLIKECNELDFHVVIFTASSPERFLMMEEYCQSIGIKINGINRNYEGLPNGMGTAGKIYYNILLDDRAGLYSSYIALREVVDQIKLERQNGNNS
ncbi:MAG: hypothetical protein HC836_36195 [Richelia sp. RM2_1_2]|nr:hypothetical protein [Richelia sp. RM2_1_2]